MAVFWDRVTGVQAAPPGWAVAASAAVALLIVLSPRLWRLTRIAITIAHESGHALVSLLSGRRLEGIRLHADTYMGDRIYHYEVLRYKCSFLSPEGASPSTCPNKQTHKP